MTCGLPMEGSQLHIHAGLIAPVQHLVSLLGTPSFLHPSKGVPAPLANAAPLPALQDWRAAGPGRRCHRCDQHDRCLDQGDREAVLLQWPGGSAGQPQRSLPRCCHVSCFWGWSLASAPPVAKKYCSAGRSRFVPPHHTITGLALASCIGGMQPADAPNLGVCWLML